MNTRFVYLDHAATTYTCESAITAMSELMRSGYANASSAHSFGAASKRVLDESRAFLLSTLTKEGTGTVLFTSGGSESDNLAVKGTAEAHPGGHIITTAFEHSAVIRSCEALEKKGYRVTRIRPGLNGLITAEQVKNAVTPDTFLISVMAANNEIGTLQPLREIGAVAKTHDILFHTDAVQAYAQVPIDVDECAIDLLSVSAHKFHGPKGVGFLYVRDSVRLESLIHGGGQERGLRAGTENVPGIAGMTAAAKEAFSRIDETMRNVTALRNYMIDELMKAFPDAVLNGSREHRLPNNINFSFPGIPAGKLLELLDKDGICVSTGSACASGSRKASRVLTAIGASDDGITGSLRMTLDHSLTKDEIDYSIDCLKKNIGLLKNDRPVSIFSI